MSFGVKMTVEDLLAGVAGDATLRDLFALSDQRMKALDAARALERSRREPVAAAVARVLATEDGRILLQAMIDMTFRAHVDVVGLGLPSDLALQQLVAENARKEFVAQLIRLAREGAGQPAERKQEG
jgi:hypothetical protein